MVVYSEGGGKTTFAATAPRPIIADCENGSKYFGLRGIATDVALIEKWDDMGSLCRSHSLTAIPGDHRSIVS